MTIFRSRRTALGLAASALAIAGPAGQALAQQSAAPVPAPAVDSAGKAGEPIVVTGTRLRRLDYQTASPVVSFGQDLLQQTGTTSITDALVQLPALVGSETSRDNAGGNPNAGIGSTGLNLLNLRNLGVDRTLVLVDGRRHVSGVEGSQAVDINTIPADLIERFDILTGGASAIYGADGVTGVVNFVLRKNFEGVSARVQSGISRYGDAGERFAAVTAGHNFAGGRGNIAIAYEFGDDDRLNAYQRTALSGRNAVGFYENPDYVSGKAGVYRFIPLNDVRYMWSARNGAVDVDFDGEPDFTGTGKRYNHGITLPGGFSRGSDDTLVSDYSGDLRAATTRHVANLIGHFDVSTALQLFAEAKYANTKSYSISQPTFDYYLFVPSDNPYIPAAIRAAIDPANGGVLVTRDNFDLGQRGENIKRETFRSVLGAKGDLAPALHYEVSWVNGRTDVTNRFTNDRYTDRFMAALDAVRDPGSGKVTCRVNVDPRASAAAVTFKPGECLPFNLFGEGVSSQAAVNWIHASTTERSRLTQNVVTGALSGDTRGFLNLPGGPAGFVLGAEYRRETSWYVPDVLEQQGLTFVNKLAPSAGRFDVKEAFGELDLPLLKDRPFAHLLDISGAVRLADYSSTGSATTWKVDASWAPVSDITFRGTVSQAVRAPNIGELYGAAGQTFAFFDDPCRVANRGLGKSTRAANCQALLAQSGLNTGEIATFDDTRNTNISGTQGGNAALSPEKARTWTAGIVLQPRMIRGLQLSLDWYDIRLRQAINTVDAQKLAELCVDQPTIDNPYCTLITRTAGTGLIDGFTLQPQNVAAFRTAGLDINARYAFSVPRLGAFALRLVGGYLDTLTFVDSPGAEPRNTLGETYQPRWQAYASADFVTGPLRLGYSLSWWDKTLRYSRDRLAGDPNYVAPEYAWYKERWEQNVSATVTVAPRFEFYGGVTNLFDQKPDIGSRSYPTDYTGRAFYAGARARF